LIQRKNVLNTGRSEKHSYSKSSKVKPLLLHARPIFTERNNDLSIITPKEKKNLMTKIREVCLVINYSIG
jgi:hypothetical protein